MNKLLAEFFGTAALVLIGCGAVAIGGYGSGGAAGAVAIALAFGLTVTVMAYAFGSVSGGHFNPAVSTAMLFAGRMSPMDFVQYVVAQFAGAIAGAFLLTFILAGKAKGYDVAVAGLGQNMVADYNMSASMVVEILATFIFTTVILRVTGDNGAGQLAPLAIGLTLFLLILVFLSVTGLSVNPARSFGPALFVGGKAFSMVWIFIVYPMIGGALAGLLAKVKAFG